MTPISTYQYVQAITFGLNTAPMAWTKVLAPIMEILHLRGIYISPNLDDFITQAAERRTLSQALHHSTDILLNAGFVINIKMSEMMPTKCVSPQEALQGPSGNGERQSFRRPSRKRLQRSSCNRRLAPVKSAWASWRRTQSWLQCTTPSTRPPNITSR